ncbi:hypothetical protein DERF_010279 [Dermatophagoides farinae]|uniref:Uncharacterized protein n=1 Tax=Dermatophagoides farinae TaxID=6954 RepID=A0A922L4V3_DERFA|nr:hypothetical protein DERF_010279 [Dermatophagoides farinae]
MSSFCVRHGSGNPKWEQQQQQQKSNNDEKCFNENFIPIDPLRMDICIDLFFNKNCQCTILTNIIDRLDDSVNIILEIQNNKARRKNNMNHRDSHEPKKKNNDDVLHTQYVDVVIVIKLATAY